ncbi:MAG: ribosome assembly factor SBDS [Thaumarchaeota archaeon]|nr:ribosome assembly factor SBDS [Nitrososphaerota archaeon]
MSTKFTTVRLTISGEHFEILVNPDNALNYKLGRKIELSQVIAVDEVYSDSSKGLRVSAEKLVKFFRTQDVAQVAKAILEKGELQMTTDQRRRQVEEKRKQIINFISRNFIDPKTGLPHPPLRIEQALQQVRVTIDPFKPAEEQAKAVVDQMRTILPLKSEKMKIMVKIPAQFAPQSMGILKGFGESQKEEWGADGTLTALLEIPAGAHVTLIDKLGAVTKGAAQVNVIR